MDSERILRLIGVVIAFIIAIAVLRWVIRNVIGIIVTVAIIAGILYLIRNAFGKRQSF
ncbi:MAG TPA: hypothetical protein PK384_14535 [Candidatus Latescibacteria bacterium]|nr:hypothetical protein [Candidatus Latescibacterota bacterium]